MVLPSWWGDGQTQIWVLGVLANGLAKASLVILLERCVTMVAISILGLIIVYRQYSNKYEYLSLRLDPVPMRCAIES